MRGPIKSLLLGLALMNTAPGGSAAQQPASIAPPVPGPYQVLPPMPQTAKTQANPYSNPSNQPPVPYWMRRRASPAPVAPSDSNTGAPSQGQPRFIPGWVWSPSPATRGTAPETVQPRQDTQRAATGWSPYYGPNQPGQNAQAARPGYGPAQPPYYGPATGVAPWPGYPGAQTAPGYWNAPAPQPGWPARPAQPVQPTN